MKRVSTSSRRTAGRTICVLKKRVGSKTLCLLTDKVVMLEGLCNALFGKVLNRGVHRLTSKSPAHNTMESPTGPVRKKKSLLTPEIYPSTTSLKKGQQRDHIQKDL